MRRLFYIFTLLIAVSLSNCYYEEIDPGNWGPPVNLQIADKLRTLQATASSDTIPIECNYPDWIAEVDMSAEQPVEWCKVTQENNNLIIHVEENTELNQRSAKVKIWAGHGNEYKEDNIEVTQYGMEPALDVPSALAFRRDESEEWIPVMTNLSGWIVTGSTKEWCEAKKSGTNLVLKVEENNDEEVRSAVVYLEASIERNGKKETVNANLTVYQIGTADALQASEAALVFNAEAEGKSFTVISSSGQWEPTLEAAASSWCEVTKDGHDRLQVNLAKNEEGNSRNTKIILSDGELTHEVVVMQLGTNKELLVAPRDLEFDGDGGSKAIGVATNYNMGSWEFDDYNLPTWLTPTQKGNNLEVKVEQNPSNVNPRFASIEIYMEGENDQLIREVVNIVQMPQMRLELSVGDVPVANLLDMDVLGGEMKLTVDTDQSVWEAEIKENDQVCNWCSFEKGPDYLLIKTLPNTDERIREAVLTVTAGSGDYVKRRNVIIRQNVTTDRDVLMAFYEATGGNNWKRSDNWGSERPLSEWYGVEVTTTSTGEYVTSLNLMDNGLTGTIPASLGGLVHLNSLNLSQNQLTGNIPEELGELTELRSLRLGSNQLTGVLPAGLGQLTRLTTLELERNNFDEQALPDWLTSLTSLESLALAGANFSGSLLPELGNLTALRGLYLQQNNLTGSVPAEFSRLTALTQFCLSGNRLSGSVPKAVYTLPNWESFQPGINILPQQEGTQLYLGSVVDREALIAIYNALGGNTWTNNANWCSDRPLSEWYGVICNEEDRVVRLSFGYAHNKLKGTIPPEIGNLTELTYLAIEGDKEVIGTIPVEIGNLTKLTHLSFSSLQLSGRIPAEIGRLTELTFLNLNSNELEGNLPTELGNLRKLTSLWLGYNNLEGTLPVELGNLTALTQLNLQGNRFTGEIPAELRTLPNWSNFDAPQNIIPQQSGYGFTIAGKAETRDWLIRFYNAMGGSAWTNNTNWCSEQPVSEWYGVTCTDDGDLFRLELSNNNLTGEIPAMIGEMKQLETLNLSNNNLSGSLPAEITQLTELVYFNLQSNRLSGEIPDGFGQLSKLGHLNLSYNQFSGDIRKICKMATTLYYLALSKNHFSGVIPTEIGNLSNLSYLFLGDNDFTGVLPVEMSKLSDLLMLSLANNRFTGTFPPEIRALRHWDLFNADVNIFPQQSGYGFTGAGEGSGDDFEDVEW